MALEPVFKFALLVGLYVSILFVSLFNAKVLAKDIFFLCCILAFCSALWVSPSPSHCPLAGPFMSRGLWGFKECWAT